MRSEDKLLPPVDVVHLLPVLDKMLLELLQSLTPDEWQAQTVARLWKVKDVVAHLLDTNIRILSIIRDGYQGEQPDIKSYQDLLDFLNGLNADWVKAMKRVSPPMLILLHQVTGPLYCEYYLSLNPFDNAAFSVAWAGEAESKNWMHLAREYTEKWLHQQQIRAAVNKPALMTREFFYPFMNVFMLALPHTYQDIKASEGTTVAITIPTEIGGTWCLTRGADSWVLSINKVDNATTTVTIQPDIAWPLFSKSIRPADLNPGDFSITGDESLGRIALEMVSVMA